MPEFYIGIMSGTSLDAIDLALVDLSHKQAMVAATLDAPLPRELKQEILALNTPETNNELDRSCQLDRKLGQIFGEHCLQLLRTAGISPKQIKAIGSHGQTIRHQPDLTTPYTLQIGDPNTIAEITGITTIADFRRRDIAALGQGAPLVPAFHQALFAEPDSARAIINIGGMANISYLQSVINPNLIGFDTGPGNCLLDAWVQLHRQVDYDKDGLWAQQGQVQQQLLQQLLSCEYFHLTPPKSTGREQFNVNWLEQQLALLPAIAPVDVQATLAQLTIESICQDLQRFTQANEVYVCGGGAFNTYLMQGLKKQLPQCSVTDTQTLGLAPDWVEACAFAWLAQQCLQGLAGNHPDVTGAKGLRILGGIYTA